MDYCLLKLRFDRAVHFGSSDSSLSLSSTADHFCADTLFSALCHVARSLHGDAGIERLCRWVECGELLLSDSMPWRTVSGQDVFYLPKPCISAEGKRELPPQLRKRVKKQSWIPINDMGAFQSALSGETVYVPDDAAFGKTDGAVPRNQRNLLYLGGGAGYFSKTLTYPYLGDRNGLETTSALLARSFRRHRHEEDVAVGISPHMEKYGRVNDQLYHFGVCEVSIQ